MGFFFSFLSFGVLVQLGDFGLSYAALQTAGNLAGTGRLAELHALGRRVASWNVLASIFTTLVVTAIGWATFSGRASGIDWRAPWIGYLAAVFVSQLTMPRISLREGGGKIEAMWRLRLIQELLGAIACLLALHAGARLWSLVALASARATVAVAGLVVVHPLRATGEVPPYTLARWMKDVWPFQWKIGLSSVAGFLIFRAFTPIVLVEQGAVAAGQFGLAIALMNLLIAVSSSWPLSQAARYATMYASGRYRELRHDFPRMLWGSTALCAAATVSLGFALWEARKMGLAFAMKLPDPITTFVIIATAIVHHFVAAFAVFLRAEGREPLLIASVIGGIMTVVAIWLVGYYGTLRELALVNLACASTGIPIVLYLFRSRSKYYLSQC